MDGIHEHTPYYCIYWKDLPRQPGPGAGAGVPQEPGKASTDDNNNNNKDDQCDNSLGKTLLTYIHTYIYTHTCIYK